MLFWLTSTNRRQEAHRYTSNTSIHGPTLSKVDKYLVGHLGRSCRATEALLCMMSWCQCGVDCGARRHEWTRTRVQPGAVSQQWQFKDFFSRWWLRLMTLNNPTFKSTFSYSALCRHRCVPRLVSATLPPSHSDPSQQRNTARLWTRLQHLYSLIQIALARVSSKIVCRVLYFNLSVSKVGSWNK